MNSQIIFWDFGDGITSIENNPLHTFSDTGTYIVKLIATDSLGCTDTITQIVIINGGFEVFIPNSFSPDADGLNDIFEIKGIGILNSEYYIFNNFGIQIFYSNSITNGWNGIPDGSTTKVQLDIFTYLINLTDIDGIKHKYVGHLSVIH